MKDRAPFEEYFKLQLEQEAGQKIPSIVIREADDPPKKPGEPEKKKDDPEVPVDMTHRPAEPRGTSTFQKFIGAAARDTARVPGKALDYLKGTAMGQKAAQWMSGGVGDYVKEVLGNIGKKMFNAYVPFGDWEGMQTKLVEIRGSDIVPGIIENVLDNRIDSEEHQIFASSMAAKNSNVVPRIADLHPAYYMFLTDYVSTKGTVLPMHSARLSGWRMKPRYSITAVPDPTPVKPLLGKWGGEHDTLQFALEAIEAWPGGEAPFVHGAIRASNQKLKLVNYVDPPAEAEEEKDTENLGSEPVAAAVPAESIEAAYGQIINEDAGDKFDPKNRIETGADGGTEPNLAVEPEGEPAGEPAAEEDTYYGPPSAKPPVKDNIFIQKIQEEYYKGEGTYKDPKTRTQETAYSIVRSSLAGTSQTHGGMNLRDGIALGMHELKELAQGVSNDHYIIKHSDLRMPEDELVKTLLKRLATTGDPEELGEETVEFQRLRNFIHKQGQEAVTAWESEAGEVKTLVDEKEHALRFEKLPAGEGGKLMWKFTILPAEGEAAATVSGVKNVF